VLLALAVAGFGLMFTFSEQRREQLGLNRAAVETARGEAIRAEFQDDPHNTFAEFKATFPRHAFCAALGFFVAENGRLNRSRLDRPNEEVRRMNDALLLEVEALADTEGVGADALARLRADAAARATAGENEPGCAVVRAARGPAAFFAAPECLLVIDSFGQNECNIARWTAQRRDAIRAEQVAMGAPPEPVPTVPADLAPGPARPAEPAPPAPCAAPPLVFTQFVDPTNRTAVEALRERLLQAGWQMAPAENTPEGRTTGDLRIYWEDQRPCAEALAALVGAQLARPIEIVSLAGRYQGLPRGQMELWLPALE
jgi:hypothetical protein